MQHRDHQINNSFIYPVEPFVKINGWILAEGIEMKVGSFVVGVWVGFRGIKYRKVRIYSLASSLSSH